MKRSPDAVIALLFFLSGCSGPQPVQKPVQDSVSTDIKAISFSVVDSFRHDTSSYTEGLLFHQGKLFESTGHTDNYPQTHSLFGVLDTTNGRISVKVRIDDRKYFGEGIAFLKKKIFQLTDTTQIGFIYDAISFRKTGQFAYKGEGWGLTTNGTELIMSNGSSLLTYRNPEGFGIVKTLSVTDNNGPVRNLNELELVAGFIYANQWLTDYILKIDTLNGHVVGRMDISFLHQRALAQYSGSEEANGIAWDPATGRLYITGKLWPKGYELQVNP